MTRRVCAHGVPVSTADVENSQLREGAFPVSPSVTPVRNKYGSVIDETAIHRDVT
jgi:hypothetical protein